MPVETELGRSQVNPSPVASPESIRVRCPHCRKLYLVQYSDIQESKPRFECVSCHDRFWISVAEMDFSGEVEGLPLQVKEAPPRPKTGLAKPAATEPCPKCFKLNLKTASECAHCGVVFAKTRRELDFKEPVPPHSPALEALWRGVIASYEVSERHDEFIRAAQKEGNLGYAAALYRQMLKLMPLDEISLARMNQVRALGEIIAPPPPATKLQSRPSSPWRASRLWQIPLLGGVICLVVGISLPAFRNIAGVGAALLFLAYAIKPR